MAQIIDNYELLEKLGSGSMGEVFKTRDPESNQYLAIKLLSKKIAHNDLVRDRFQREIYQTLQLDHPNLLTKYSAGEVDGILYYTMEYIEGVTAKKELFTHGVYGEVRIWEIMLQISQALEYLWRQGIIHRDIKPENIMISNDGRAKLCDTGLAKATASGNKVTFAGSVLGTPRYMSPEQAQGKEDLDTRSDIFSLGATCYYLLTGALPFEKADPNPIHVLAAIVNEEPAPIQERNPNISNATCAVIAKMMAKNCAHRYQNFSEVIADLCRLKRKEMTTAEQSYQPQPTAKKYQFKKSHVPSEVDVIAAQIAINSKLIAAERMDLYLNRQEALAQLGIRLDLSSVFLEQGTLSAQQKGILDKAVIQFILDRGDEMTKKICHDKKLVTTQAIAKWQHLENKKIKGIGGYMVNSGDLTPAAIQKIYANFRHSLGDEESRLVFKTAMENGLLSKIQAEKCLRMYANNVVMDEFKDIGEIILEKEYLTPNTLQAIVRAIRRSMLTGKDIAHYIADKRI